MDSLLAQDLSARAKALNPNQSFIVQAPAGSGKTELLTQRYLVLLGHAQRGPEEIVAVTFTKKAQAEMRQRIVDALKMASLPEPEESHKKQTWQLAKKVLEKDAHLHWHLLENPNRLRVMTIDSLSHHLVARMPLLSQFGANAQLSQDPELCYQQSIEAFLQTACQQPTLRQHLKDLIGHLDNRVDLFEALASKLLANRDQWLSHVYPFSKEPERGLDYLQGCIERAIERHLTAVYERFTPELNQQLATLLSWMDANTLTNCQLEALVGVQSLPEPNASNLAILQALAKWWLTDKGTCRKKVTKAQGFVAPSQCKDKQEKEQAKQRKTTFEQFLSAIDEVGIAAPLHALTRLPDVELQAVDATVLRSLFALLPLMVAHLKVVFKERGEVDFIEVLEAALTALGPDESPSDLALSLDYQIQHLLVDEFQDTSVPQFELFEKLIRGWQPGDGRTCFLVGDPQQSIYRFRGAEVGLFLRAKHQGIGGFACEFLQLRQNFRSNPNIVHWTNQIFVNAFPNRDDIAMGAVPFSESVANGEKGTGSVEVWCFDSKIQECSYLAHWVSEHPEIAKDAVILTRARTHVRELVEVFNQWRIPFKATDLEPMLSLMPVVDLLSLTQAWLNPADTKAWVALLRAPWCGLAMRDIWLICKASSKQTLPVVLSQLDSIEGLSPEATVIAKRLYDTYQAFNQHRGRQSLAYSVEAWWRALGGEQCYAQDVRSFAQHFFTLLQAQPQAELSYQRLIEKLQTTFVPQSNQSHEHAIEIMTAHKAKGLEFDTVIVPSTEKRPRGPTSALLLWQEQPTADGVDLLIAPAKSASAEPDKLYRYIQDNIQQKDELESTRLLYVAATRAKQRLFISASLDRDENGQFKKPAKQSFLGKLGDGLDIIELTSAQIVKSVETTAFSRLPAAFESPYTEYIQGFALSCFDDKDEANRPERVHHQDTTVGTLVHQILQSMALEGLSVWERCHLSELKSSWNHFLYHRGFRDTALTNALDQIQQCVETVLSCKRGRWILSEHKEAKQEWQLARMHNDQMTKSIIDRSFVDDQGVRWIIDYKVTQGDIDPSKYWPQLQRYAKWVGQFESKPIRLGLYFPYQGEWYEQAVGA